MKRIFRTTIIFFAVCFFSGCSQAGIFSGNGVTGTEFMLDTIVAISLYDTGDDNILEEAFGLARNMEGRYSHKKNDSIPKLLQTNAGKDYTTLDADSLNLLEKSMYYSELSKGAFDVTIGPLVDLWNISGGGHYPQTEELESAKALVGYENLILSKGEAMLKNSGMSVNFGAIAKGFIGDKVKEYLLEKGIKSGLLDFGGDIVLIGSKPDGSNFNIGVQDPLLSSGDYFAVLSLADKCVVTSGAYERYFTYNEVNYHHIIDPKTGFPADSGLIQVTIIAQSLTDSDALSTAAFIMGLEEGMKLVEAVEGAEGIFVTENKKVYLSSGIGEELRITDSAYEIQ